MRPGALALLSAARSRPASSRTWHHSKAPELKRELDRLGVFKLCEDRFLDLFEPPLH